MLPVTHGVRYTLLQTLLYTLLLFAVSLLPFATGMSGPLYRLGAVVLGLGFLYWAVAMLRGSNPRAPIETFRYSILYIMTLFPARLLDHHWRSEEHTSERQSRGHL